MVSEASTQTLPNENQCRLLCFEMISIHNKINVSNSMEENIDNLDIFTVPWIILWLEEKIKSHDRYQSL